MNLWWSGRILYLMTSPFDSFQVNIARCCQILAENGSEELGCTWNEPKIAYWSYWNNQHEITRWQTLQIGIGSLCCSMQTANCKLPLPLLCLASASAIDVNSASSCCRAPTKNGSIWITGRDHVQERRGFQRFVFSKQCSVRLVLDGIGSSLG